MSLTKVDICLSPDLYSLYSEENQIVVVVDVIRASTSICVAISNNVCKIIPVDTIEKAKELRTSENILSGERDSLKIEEFDLGNSPLEFFNPILKGKDLVMTTTNGTKAIKVAESATQLLIGSFINHNVLLKYLLKSKKNVLILCAGWKGTINIEDTLYAGYLAQGLLNSHLVTSFSDSVSLAISIYERAKENIYNYIIESSPRLKSKLSFINDDINYCLFGDQLEIIPEYSNGSITNLKFN